MSTNLTEYDRQFTRDTAEANGVSLHYHIGGTGDAAVLLWHGFLGTSHAWRKVMPLLARSYKVVAPDMRGYGDSDKPAGGYDARTLKDDFRQLVRQLGFGRVFIIAHDMGAPPALLYAAEHPEEVLGLVYLEEPVITQENMEQAHKFAPETLKNGGLWWWAFALASDMPERLVAGREREFLTWFYENYTADRASIEGAAVDEYLRTFAAPGGVTGAFGVYRAILETMKQTEPLAKNKTEVPVLALGGELSMGDLAKQMMQTVAGDVRGGAVKGCGHFIPEEQPAELVRQATAFLKTCGAGERTSGASSAASLTPSEGDVGGA